MRSLKIHQVMRALFVASLTLNVALLTAGAVHVSKRGGVRYVKQKLGLAHHEFEARPFQNDKLELFRMLPDSRADIVFAGDSHVAGTPYAEVYTPIRNRGIGGDTTAGILLRLDEIIDGKPERVFLEIGSNDIANRIPAAETMDNYRQILKRIRQESPNTRVFIQSLPPINREVPRAYDRNPVIRKLNADLALLAAAEGATFIDLDSVLADEKGDLKKEFSMEDGLHLNPAGRLAMCEALRPYLPPRPDSIGGHATWANDKAAP
jgi:lysophospholipase L1-like esterase